MKRIISNIFCLLSFCITIRSATHSITAKCAQTLNCTLDVDEKFMSCKNQNLTSIPRCINERIESLDVSGSFIQRLLNCDFPSNLNNLNILILRNISLKIIHNSTFANLEQLQDLDLSVNFLRSIYAETFSSNMLLQRLNLSKNLIKKLAPNQFVLPVLKILDVSDCLLEVVDNSAFSNLTSLQWLNLKDNKLKTLPLGIQVPSLLLGNNPWTCDCDFYSVVKIYMNDGDQNNLRCTDDERNHLLLNETNLTNELCHEYYFNRNFSNEVNNEKSSRMDDAPELILNIYGYVFVGLIATIFFCCCCDSSQTRRKLHPDQN